ncbi:hypothetical protein C5167_030878 [Papaver somniferum]|nr:hypothetical protein C5167_030878 [Papaver somniferum]
MDDVHIDINFGQIYLSKPMKITWILHSSFAVTTLGMDAKGWTGTGIGSGLFPICTGPKYPRKAPDDSNDADGIAPVSANASRYKILSYMARDILAMPVSSVASESAFSTGKRVLTPWRASMSTRTVEALLCTQSFLQKPIALDLLCDYIPDDAVEDEAGKKPVPEWNRTGLTGTGTSPGPGTGTGPQIEEPVNSVYSCLMLPDYALPLRRPWEDKDILKNNVVTKTFHLNAASM